MMRSGQLPQAFLTDTQQYSGVERIGSKPMAFPQVNSDNSDLAGIGCLDAGVVGQITALMRRLGLRHDQYRHPHRLRHALDGRQTRIALAAFNLRQMLLRHAHLGRQYLQRQTTLVALAAQEGGNQSVHG
jgi:hypothetical protein